VPPIPPTTCSVLIPALTSSDATLKVWLDAGYTASYTQGSNVWYDLTANGNNVYLSGSLGYDSCTGSIEFPGLTSSFAGTSTATGLNPGSGSLSTEVWVRTRNGVTASQSNYIHIMQVGYMIVDRSLDAYSTEYTNTGWSPSVSSNPIVVRTGKNEGTDAAPAALASGNYASLSSSFDNWTQIVMTRDGSSLKNYVNGVLNASASISGGATPDNTNLLRLGLANELDIDRQFDAAYSGSISSLKIWVGKELSATEVSASYAYMKTRFNKS
jgi:hypothetical protein